MSLTRALQMTALTALAVVTVVLVVLAMTRTIASPVADAAPVAPGAAATGTSRPIVSVLGDDHVLREGSWFYRAVPAEPGGPVTRGVVLAAPTATAADLGDQLDQVAPGDAVLIAAGSNDLAAGGQPVDIVRDLRELVRGVEEQGGVPLLTLLPPDDRRSFKTKLVNRRLRDLAGRSSVSLIDVHSPVATTEGRWRSRFSDDGEYANEQGATRQADAVVVTLPWAIAATGS